MVSTVTTSVTSVTTVTSTTTTTSAGVTTGDVAVFGLMAALTLVILLSFQEVMATGDNLLVRRLCRTANTAVVPLLFALAATVAIKVAAVL